MTADARAAADGGAEIPAAEAGATGGFLERLSARSGVSRATLSAGILLPFLALIVIIATTAVART